MPDPNATKPEASEESLLAACVDFELGALEGEELRALERRLEARDPEALQALAEARSLLGDVGRTVPPEYPDPGLKARLMAAIEPEPLPAPESADAPSSSSPVKLPWWAAAGWAVAAAMVAFVFFSSRQSDELREALAVIEQRQEQLEATNDEYRRLVEILGQPETRAVTLDAADRADIKVFWNERSGLALTAENLDTLPAGRAYQLWAIPIEGAPVSIDVFRPNEQERALIFAQPSISPTESQALAMTEEDAAGAEQPTSDPIWMGPLQ